MLKHLKTRDDWDQKSLSAKGFTLIELLVVIIILGVLAAVVIFAVGSVRDRAETNACKTDTKTLKTAIVAWNTEYLSGDASGTPATQAWPDSLQDLFDADLIQTQNLSSAKHTITGDGNTPPTIAANGTQCADEGSIDQIT